MVSCDILQFLKKNFNQIAQGNDTYQRALYAADVYLRQHIVKGYRYDENYTFFSRRKSMRQLRSLRNKLSKNFRQQPLNENLQDIFQTEKPGLPQQSRSYRPNGFELEFYVPEEFGNYDKLINYLKKEKRLAKIVFIKQRCRCLFG